MKLSVDTKQWEEDVLSYNPFADDKDDGGCVILSDKIVTARVPGICAECLGPVIPGTRVRSMSAALDGKASTARSCHECCNAMVEWVNGNPGPMTARCGLGYERRSGQCD